METYSVLLSRETQIPVTQIATPLAAILERPASDITKRLRIRPWIIVEEVPAITLDPIFDLLSEAGVAAKAVPDAHMPTLPPPLEVTAGEPMPRGFFLESYHAEKYRDGGISETDQDPEFGDPEAFEEVADLEDDLGEDIDEETDVPDRIRKAGLIGIWQYTKKHEGWFAGKLWVRVKGKRVLIGRVKGVFAKSLLGVHEMAGVILDRDGKVRGKIEGIYSVKGFRAKWSVDGGEKQGKAKAKFVAPYGRAGFVGIAYAPREAYDDGK